MKKILLTAITVLGLCLLSACGQKKEKVEFTNLNSKNASYYQIFVRSFADSNGDGIGDFTGIKNNLDYIYDLGFEGIWLMPFLESTSYHGYDVENYYDVEKDYGTMDEFAQLLDACHAKGIKVIMDFVLNHTSYNHPWFQSVLKGETTYYDYYVWANNTDKRVTNSQTRAYWHPSSAVGKSYYGYFSSTMPDLNYNSSKVLEEIVSIQKFWIDKGIDGFRLDGALHIVGLGEDASGATISPTINRLKYVCEAAETYAKETYKKSLYYVGEVWDESGSQNVKFYEALDSTFNFNVGKTIISAINAGASSKYLSTLTSLLTSYKESAERSELDRTAIDAPFLTNHDMSRIASQLKTKEQCRMAAEMLLMLEGNPFVYYGEELGMKGEKSQNGAYVDEAHPLCYDEFQRMPFLWQAGSTSQTTWITNTVNDGVSDAQTQMSDDSSLYQTYKTLLNLRKKNIALKYGTYEALSAGSNSVLAFTRTYTEGDKTKQVLVIHCLDKVSSIGSELLSMIENKEVLYYSLGSFAGSMEKQTTLVVTLKD